MNSVRRISILSLLVLAVACGGEPKPEKSTQEQDDPYAGDPRLGRIYYVEIEKDQPPDIRLSLQLRRGGIARIIFQHGNARAFREEKGRWHREGGNLIVELDPSSGELDNTSLPVGGSDFQSVELPSRLEFDIGPNALAIRIPTLSDEYLQFVRSSRDRD